MLLTPARGPETVLLAPEHHKTLRGCDEVSRFKEAGWHYAIGFKGNKAVLSVHARQAEDIDRALGLRTAADDLRALCGA